MYVQSFNAKVTEDSSLECGHNMFFPPFYKASLTTKLTVNLNMIEVAIIYNSCGYGILAF